MHTLSTLLRVALEDIVSEYYFILQHRIFDREDFLVMFLVRYWFARSVSYNVLLLRTCSKRTQSITRYGQSETSLGLYFVRCVLSVTLYPFDCSEPLDIILWRAILILVTAFVYEFFTR